MSTDQSQTRSPRPVIDFVLPIYNESGNIELLHRELSAAVAEREADYSFRFVFVNDGSRDNSLDLLLQLRDRDSRVQVLSLARNSGHQIAVTAGLDHADGDAVIVMDTDLQDPPRVAMEMISRWEAGADVVYGQRASRKDTAFKKVTAHAFYWTLSKLSSVDIPRNTGDFRLMDHRVVLELRKYREHHRFLRGMVAQIGFRQEALLFDRDARFAGVTGYPFRKMVKFALDGVLGFSVVPLQLISRIGFVISLLSLVAIIYIAAVRLLQPESTVPGWAFVTIAIFLLGGIQVMMLGILGAYIGRIYVESQNRPLYAIGLAAGEFGARDEARTPSGRTSMPRPVDQQAPQ